MLVVFSPQLYVTFWALSMFDLYVPSERYEQELSKLKQQQAQLDDNKDMVCHALKRADLRFLIESILSFMWSFITFVLVTNVKQNKSEMMLCYKINRFKRDYAEKSCFSFVMILILKEHFWWMYNRFSVPSSTVIAGDLKLTFFVIVLLSCSLSARKRKRKKDVLFW